MPIRAVDQVLSLDEAGIRTRKAVTASEPFFPGHYPEYPIFPGVFIIEAVHQAVRVYAARFHGSVRLKEVRSSRFHSALRPGDVLECDCRCTLDGAGLLQVKARGMHQDTKAASVRLVYELVEEAGAAADAGDSGAL